MSNTISVPFVLARGPAGPSGTPGTPGPVGPAGPSGAVTPGAPAQIPVTNAGASAVVMQTISQDVTVSATGVAAVQGAHIPAGIATPEFAHSQATSGGIGQLMRIRSQASQAASGAIGGDMSLVIGKTDGTPLTRYPTFWIGEELVVGGANEPGATNYFNYLQLFRNASNNVNMNLGGGTNNSGAGAGSVEISSFGTLGIATEALAGGSGTINLSPASLTGGLTRATWNFIAHEDGAPQMQIGATSAGACAANGVVSLDWSGSSTYQALLHQRDSGNANDLPIAARWTGQLALGSFAENPALWGQSSQTFRTLQSGTGFQFQNQSAIASGTQALFTVASDTHASLVQGDTLAGTSDAVIQQIYSANTTATTASQTIATIPIRSGTNAAVYLTLVIEGRCPGTGDVAAFERRAMYTNNAGAITLIGSVASIGNDPHTAGAGASINPLLTISGGNLLVQVTPWTATATHWTVYPDQIVNSSAATAPTPTLPGSPVIHCNADAQATGSTTTWTDQSGNAHNLTSQGTAPTNTASAGPSGAQNALVFGGAGYMQISNAMGLGVSNCTISIVAKATSVATPQVLVSVGNSNGVLLGIDRDGGGNRNVDFNGGATRAQCGTATTAWESWILTVDSRGNWYLLVNGIPKAVNPLNQVPVTPSAFFVIAALANSTGKLTGSIYDVAAWATAQDPYAVYAYHHAITAGAV